jgi:hypothetical protein
MGALWKFGTPLALASRSLIPPKAPVLGLYPTNEGDGWGSIIKWGTHYLGFQMAPTPRSLLLHTLGFVLGGGLFVALLGSFQLDETVTHIGWMWASSTNGALAT